MSSQASSSATAAAACHVAPPTATATTVSIVPGASSFGKVLYTTTTAPTIPTTGIIVPKELIATKKAMRQSIQQKLDALTPAQLHSESSRVHEALWRHPQYTAAKALCLFISMPSGEIQTGELIRRALKDGKKVFVPRVEPMKKPSASPPAASSSTASTTSSSSNSNPPPPAAAAVPQPKQVSLYGPAPGQMQLLQLQSMEELESMVPNRWGIREPGLTLPNGELRQEARDCEELSLVICPGVAFDSGCQRLGHGKGYYDSYLKSIPRPVYRLAIALDEQVVQQVPVGIYDVQLDEIVTPNSRFLKKPQP